MALSQQDQRVLQEIVDANGACLDSKRCAKCPFRASCLPEFLNPTPPSQPQRFRMALDVLTHNLLVDDDITAEEVQREYEWDKK